MLQFFAVLSLFNVCIGVPSGANQYFSNAQLHPNCLKVEPTPELSAEWGMQLFAGARFYIPFGNKNAIHHISKLISSETDAKTREGSSSACALVRIKGFKLHIEGRGENFMIQDCAVVKKGVNHCEINARSGSPDLQKQGDGIFTIIWTDNESSMAVVRCTSNGLYNDWYVFSTQTSLNDTIKNNVLSAVTKLGFSDTLEKTLSPSYEGCTLFDPNEED